MARQDRLADVAVPVNVAPHLRGLQKVAREDVVHHDQLHDLSKLDVLLGEHDGDDSVELGTDLDSDIDCLTDLVFPALAALAFRGAASGRRAERRGPVELGLSVLELGQRRRHD